MVLNGFLSLLLLIHVYIAGIHLRHWIETNDEAKCGLNSVWNPRDADDFSLGLVDTIPVGFMALACLLWPFYTIFQVVNKIGKKIWGPK